MIEPGFAVTLQHNPRRRYRKHRVLVEHRVPAGYVDASRSVTFYARSQQGAITKAERYIAGIKRAAAKNEWLPG